MRLKTTILALVTCIGLAAAARASEVPARADAYVPTAQDSGAAPPDTSDAAAPPATPPAPDTSAAPVTVPAPAPEAVAATPAPPDPADPWFQWSRGRQWLSLRAGYAKAAVTNGPHGSVGGGIGYSRMLELWKLYRWTFFKQFSLGGYVHLEHLGRFGAASELAVPVTLELVRHFRWRTPYVDPYLGIGAGAFYRKLYRSGHDLGRTRPGKYLVFGVNTPIDTDKVLGLDARFIKIDAQNSGPNPAFGPGDDNATHWSVKLNYSVTY